MSQDDWAVLTRILTKLSENTGGGEPFYEIECTCILYTHTINKNVYFMSDQFIKKYFFSEGTVVMDYDQKKEEIQKNVLWQFNGRRFLHTFDLFVTKAADY